MRIQGKVIKKQHLPHKQCPVCLRSFRWRKKWRHCWDAVIYCSERCRQQRKVEG